MKVFISWSGERSRQVAELLHTWIQCVIQAVEPWVSSSDIDRGALWFTQITNELSSTTHGIICLTGDNKDKPWILFEAGALAKGLNSSRIYTFLVDLNPEDIKDPLAQFNHTRPTKTDMFKLISSINSGLDTARLKESILVNVFETYWPQFESDFTKILAATEAVTAPEVPRTPDDMLSEILNTVRAFDKRIRTLEIGNSHMSEESKLQSRKYESESYKLKKFVYTLIRSLMVQGKLDEAKVLNILSSRFPAHTPVQLMQEYEDALRRIETGE